MHTLELLLIMMIMVSVRLARQLIHIDTTADPGHANDKNRQPWIIVKGCQQRRPVVPGDRSHDASPKKASSGHHDKLWLMVHPRC